MRFLLPLFVLCVALNVFAGEVPTEFLPCAPKKGIKQETIRTYAEDAKGADLLQEEVVCEYDERGYLTKISREGYHETFTYKFSDDGRLLSYEQVCKEQERGIEYEFVYDDKTLTEVKVWTDMIGNYKRLQCAYKCGSGGQPAKLEVYDENGKVFAKTAYEYDEANRLTKQTTSKDDSVDWGTKYHYDGAGALVASEQFAGDEDFEWSAYNDHGDRISSDRGGVFALDKNGEMQKVRIATISSCDYDSAGRKTSEKTEKVEGERKEFVCKETHEYELQKDEKDDKK